MIYRGPYKRKSPRANDPDLWQWSVRRNDGDWLNQPASAAGQPSNMETWSRKLCDNWSFDSHKDAYDAAIAHGCAKDDFTIIRSPRKAGDWLKQEGDWKVA